MTEVSPLRLWVMRAMYLVMAFGIGATIWPLIVSHGPAVPRMTGVAWALLGTVALLGLRYPLRMLPLYLFEFVWKTIWLLRFGLPQWTAGRVALHVVGSHDLATMTWRDLDLHVACPAEDRHYFLETLPLILSASAAREARRSFAGVTAARRTATAPPCLSPTP